MTYSLNYSDGKMSVIEKYHSLIKWIIRIIQLLKNNKSVLLYKPTREAVK